jgi:hypothetical protein
MTEKKQRTRWPMVSAIQSMTVEDQTEIKIYCLRG